MTQSLRLIVDGLAQRFGALSVFSGVSFTLAGGEAIAITGTNGAGKSTLLNTIAGLLPAASGSVRLEGLGDDDAIADHLHLVGTLNAIKPALTVRENLADWAGVLGGAGDHQRIDAALDRLGLDRFADMPARVLSTGWRRRLGLARVFVADRPLWLLDEPTAALDLAASRLVASLIREHLDAGGIAVVATHLDLGLDGIKSLEMAPPAAS